MIDTPLTLKEMSAEDDARVPPRLGLRVIAAVILIELLLLVAFTLASTGAARAEPLHADVSVNLSNGFARIVLRFSDETDAEVKMANGILVVNFKAPVAVSVDRLYSNAVGYVSAARRDPDGKAIRMALSQKVSVNSMMAGERLFIDLLPEGWKGMPPGLPQEIVEELATRAREAEKKARAQRGLAQQRQIPLVKVRVAHQPTFSRYVFELPELTSIGTERGKDGLKLKFEAALKFDLADAKATLPPTMEAIDSETGDEQSSVSFAFIGKVDIRSFREDNNYVVDISPLNGKPERADLAPPVAAAEPAAAAARGKTVALAGIEPPQTLPPQTLPPQPSPPEAPKKAEAAPAEPVRPPSPAPSPAAKPAEAKPVDSKPVDSKPVDSKPVDSKPVESKPVEAKSAESKPVEAKPVETKLAEAKPVASKPAPARTAEKVREPRAAVAEPVAGEGEGDQLPQVRDPNAPVRVEMRRQSDNLKLRFPFLTPTPAAIFRRADTLWLVFDNDVAIDLAALKSDATRSIQSTSVTKSQNGQIVRIKLERPRLTSLSGEGFAWTVTIGDVVMEPTKPLTITRNVSGAPRPTASIPFDEPHILHRLSDPEVGDTLLVVTALGPARGFLKEQDFVEFRVLASTHGVVIQPLADDLMADIAVDKVVIGRPAGLSLSSGAPVGKRIGSYRPQVFDAQSWGFDRETTFNDRQGKLIAAAAAAPEAKRSQPRYDLARFYLAREMYPEAKAVLDLALGDERPTSEDSTGLVMRAVSNIMLDREDEAFKDLANPLVGNQYDAPVWRAFGLARQGKWAEARAAFLGVEAAIGTLPAELQRMVLKEAVRAAIEVKDFAGAADVMNEFETLGIPRDLEPSLAVLNGRVAEGLGRNEDALAGYRAAADSNDRPSAAQGRLRETVLRYQLGDLKRSDVISELEILTTVWRGDETEVEALQLLARLYTEEARYRDAFYVMRTALKAHPNSEMTHRIQDEAAKTFNALFLAGKGDAMPAIDALSLFYDFRELTPIGRRGDEMIRRLTDRLVSVDLLDQAAELLQHQVDHRLQGAARAQVATRLAVIYLMNRKPDRALATLRATRTTDLATELRNQRLLLEARALSDIGRHEVALEVIANIEGNEAVRLRSDILWAAKRWTESAEQIELLYGDRWRDWQPLSNPERADILRAGMGYSLGEDQLGLDRFREKYAAKMAESSDRRQFEVATAPATAHGNEFRDVARTIAAVDTLDGFLRDMRARYPDTGAFVPASGENTQSGLARPDPATTGSVSPRPATKPPTRVVSPR